MPPKKKTDTASSTPGPSSGPRNILGDALYEWCRNNHEYGQVLHQNDLVSSGVIPLGENDVLYAAAEYLVSKRLFKIHAIKDSPEVGWEIVDPRTAASYMSLTRDEQMVYHTIETASTAGIWTKTIKARSGVHAKVLDRVYKSLEGRQLIKQMKSVKNPGRKMYILYNLQPSEEATGGAWFTEGRLDIEMIDAISGFVENFCSERSWREITDVLEDDDSPTNQKRKRPEGGFDDSEKGMASSKKKKTTYVPYEAGYSGYPTVRDVSKQILEKNLLESSQILPENALVQLLDVMTYDDRLFKMQRDPRQGEIPEDSETGKITMYRCFKTQADLREESHWRQRARGGSRTAHRRQELEDIGEGGASEVPCISCPNLGVCGYGGNINPETCIYIEQWYEKMEDADREHDPWPSTKPNKAPRH